MIPNSTLRVPWQLVGFEAKVPDLALNNQSWHATCESSTSKACLKELLGWGFQP